MMYKILFENFRNIEPINHVDRKSLISKLRPTVVEILSATDGLKVKEKVEKLRKVLIEESPEAIR